MRTIAVTGNETIRIGRVGENRAVQVVWTGLMKKWRELYGEGIVQLAVRRPKDTAPYPVVCEVSENDVMWTVCAADTARHGIGECELTYLVGEKVAKSQTWATEILRSLTEDEMTEPPEDPARAWFVSVQEQIGNLDELTTEAKGNLVVAINEVEQSGGGKSVQPDWNQNDDTQPDYVKNRPFYTGDPVETVLVEETTVPFAAVGGGRYIAQVPSTFVATVGETYKVYWDGTVYECSCVVAEGAHAVGNTHILGVGSDTGEPFLIGVMSDKVLKILTEDTSASHTISISGVVQEVVKIDEKYLPKGLIVNVVGTESNFGNTYLLFDKTDEEIYNAVNNGIAVTLELWGYNLQYIKEDIMFWGVAPYISGTNGITKLEVLYVSRGNIGWRLKETFITASTDANS